MFLATGEEAEWQAYDECHPIKKSPMWDRAIKRLRMTYGEQLSFAYCPPSGRVALAVNFKYHSVTRFMSRSYL